jgi:hypothetical protein
MFGSVVLDVAIGMAFVYLLMSLIASAIQEILAAFMQLRAANLERGLRSLFSGDSLGAGLDLVDSIYDHGLIRGLYADPPRDTKGLITTFRMPLDGLREWLRKKIGITPLRPVTVVSNQLLLPAYIPSRTFALAMIDILNTNKESGEAAMGAITRALAAHHWKFRDNKAGEALYALAIDANDDINAFQRNLEHWYNDGMDRVSGWYKRYTQTALIFVGLLLAIGFNVSSVRVAQTLWLDRDVREAMVSAAGNYVKDQPAPTKEAVAAEASNGSDTGNKNEPDKTRNGQEANEPRPASGDATSFRAQLQERVDALNEVTISTLLPVGWKHSFRNHWDYLMHDTANAVQSGLGALAGWLITAFAISFGAPFWFDTLNRFMVVRSTVKPQEKSTTERAKG